MFVELFATYLRLRRWKGNPQATRKRKAHAAAVNLCDFGRCLFL
jgi:hypothetical protein